MFAKTKILMKIIIISGGRGEGKTTLLKKCVDELHNRQRPVFGFYAANVVTFSGNEGYRINKVNSQKSLLLCERNNPKTGSLNLADFWFDKQAINSGEEWLKEGFDTPNPIFTLDEAGKFELDGFVWDSILKEVLKQNRGTLMVTVRNKFVNKIIEKYQLNNHTLFVQDSLFFTVEFIDKIERR